MTSPLLLPLEQTTADEHPRVALPFSVQLADRLYEGVSLSVTRIMVRGVLPPDLVFKAQNSTIHFDFRSFSAVLNLTLRPLRSSGADGPEIALLIEDPTGDHLPALRYLINSQIAGDFVHIGKLLSYTGPVTAPEIAPPTPTGWTRKLGAVLRRTAVATSAGILAALVGTVLFERVLYAYEPSPIVLEPEGQTLTAVTGGQIALVNPGARAGETLFAVAAPSGMIVHARMPCNCDISPRTTFAEGATVLVGDPVAHVSEVGAPLSASVALTPEAATLAARGARAELVREDGSIVPASVGIAPQGQSQDGLVAASVTLDAGAEADGPVRLRFRRMAAPAWVSAPARMVSGVAASIAGERRDTILVSGSGAQ